MSEYIKKDEILSAAVEVEYLGRPRMMISVAKIGQQPSIDIVRCQDCKHWVYNFNGCSRNPCTEPWLATDFCNSGERREP